MKVYPGTPVMIKVDVQSTLAAAPGLIDLPPTKPAPLTPAKPVNTKPATPGDTKPATTPDNPTAPVKTEPVKPAPKTPKSVNPLGATDKGDGSASN